ncbi:hypothetical protein PENSPDRAFT_645414 [Peniophora sp. CONT]|nr:hypothetical protein PENSPDRAFT_645414 [Peniophora sp. CONT]
MFFMGGTGFIGGSVLQLFLGNPDFELVVLTRDADKARKLTEHFGVRTVVSSMESKDDFEMLSAEAAKADVVLQTSIVTAFDAMNAILDGMKKRFERTGKKPILVYTSGGDLNAVGNYGVNEVRSDMDTEYLLNLPAEHIHYRGDTRARKADEEEGFVRTFTILPSTVWGLRRGPLADAGIGHRHSQPMPALIMASIARGQGGVVGKGLNVWSHIEVHELAELYNLIIVNALNNDGFPSGREGIYFGENGSYPMIDACKAYSQALYDAGKGRSPEPESFSQKELEDIGFLVKYIGASSVCRADRGRALGWKPVLGTDAFLASLKPEVEALLAGAA